jgi:hypothetical protein
MKEEDNLDENLDEFIIRLSNALYQKNNPEISLILNSLKEYLLSIYQDKPEMENFFKTLYSIIFSEKEPNSKIIKNSKAFKIYPIVFSFNPKSSYYYIDYFLTSLQSSVYSENNIKEFSFLSTIFGEVIESFYLDNKNKFLINKDMILDSNKKIKLYEKIFNFCNNNIKTNESTKQLLGCLLLNEFIEKCPLIKEENNFVKVFKTLSEYLDDHWFECKLDLLNCVHSLIYIQGKKFSPYANICVLKILDFFTDEDWMKRKLAVDIIYALVIYCKEEIIKVKDNIFDFLFVLKDDPIDKVSEICIKTLNLLEEGDTDKNSDSDDNNLKKSINNNNLKNINVSQKISKENNKDKITKKKNVEDKKEDIQKSINKKEKEKENYKNINNININDNFAIKNKIDYKNNNNMQTIEINIKNKDLNEKYGKSLNEILAQMKIIQETQNFLNNSLEQIRYKIDKNYSNLNSRLKLIEKET